MSARSSFDRLPHPRRGWVWALGCLLLGLALPAASLETGALDLTTPVKQNIRLLQDRWGEWLNAHMQNDEATAAAALEQLLAAVDELGMSKVPDYAATASALAVRSAEGGNFERAEWTLEAARQIDPGRPEIHFAAGEVARLSGDYVGAVTNLLGGYASLARLPVEGTVWKQNLLVWLVYLIMLGAGLFVVLQMRAYGAALIYDLSRLASPPLGPPAAVAAAIIVLLSPLALPSGVLWMGLTWSILIWGYCTLSQRAVLIFLWLAGGTLPLAVDFQQQQVAKSLQPSVRLVENLREGRLYGTMFQDLEVLEGKIEDEAVFKEILADLHRHLGQWEHARALYRGLVDANPDTLETAPILNNLGVYFYYRNDHGTAINRFTEAMEINPTLVEAHFNLAQAYAALFDFTRHNEALTIATGLAPDRVAAWEAGSDKQEVIPIDGGLIRSQEAMSEEPASMNAVSSLIVAALAVVLAVALHFLRQRSGYPSSKLKQPGANISRWSKALIPGWAATVDGNGPVALLAILPPLGLLLVPLIPVWGYRVPLGYAPGQSIVTVLCGIGLALILLIRAGLSR